MDDAASGLHAPDRMDTTSGEARLTTVWDDMFVVGIPVAERALRGGLIYLFVLVALRVTGKREIGQFSAFDLVVVLLLSETVQNGMVGTDDSVTGATIGVVVILGLNRLITWLSYHRPRFGALVEGTATPLIEDGQSIQRNLDHGMITDAELLTAAHREKVFDVDQIETAILELDGSITVVSKEPDVSEMYVETTRRLEELRAALARVEARLERDSSPAPA
jgi:uncharacterized membrane protein YcaP (DUF421 family)